MSSKIRNQFLASMLTSMTLLVFTCGAAQANQCPTLPQYQSYSIYQKLFSWGHAFDIFYGKQKVGKVVEQVLSWGRTFELQDGNGQLVAKARQQVFSFGVKVDIFDCRGRMIGSLQENILKSLFKVQTVYSILNSSGQVVGQSAKLDFFGTDIALYGENFTANLSRPYFNWFTDTWELSLSGQQSEASLNSSIYFFVAAYKSSADRDRRAAASSSSSK